MKDPKLVKYPDGEEPADPTEFEDGYAVGFSMAKKRIAELEAERSELVAALDATYAALDGLYGADMEEEIPFLSLTQDRQEAFDVARALVHRAMHRITEGAACANSEGKDL